MAIQAQLPDGTTLQFPDGTPPAIVDGAVKQHVSSKPGGTVETPESRLGFTPAPPEPPKATPPAQDEYSGAPTTIDYQPPPRDDVPRHGGLGDPGTLSGAVAEGWRDAPSFWTSPQARQAAADVPVAGPIYAAGGDLVGGILGVGNALLRGVQHTAAATAEPIGNAVPEIRIPGYGPISGTVAGGPGLGRDVAALPEAFPTGVPEEATYSGRGSTLLRPPAEPPRPQFVQEFYGEPIPGQMGPPVAPKPPTPPNPADLVPPGTSQGPTLTRINELIQADIDQAARRPAEIPPTTTKDPVTGEVQPIQQPRNPLAPEQQPPQPTAGETAPPAGAQITPPAQAGLTPEQAAAAGSTADKQWFYKTIIPGEANTIQYIKGINPTMAQQELTVNAARDSKLLRRIAPDADQNERALLGHHSELRKGEFQEIAGSDTTQQTALKDANDQIDTALSAAYAHGGTVDLQPVVDAANAELTGSAGKLPPVKSAMQAIVDAAQKSDGSGLETSPLQANAVRRAIIYMQSKEGRLENPGYGSPDTMAALTRVKDTLTKQIEPAAPGFTKANADYATARQAIDAKEALQAYEPKLYQGPLGNMTFAPFHRLMGDVIAGRDPRAPLNPYKALTEEQMNRLKSLHDDLQRVASAEELARAAGSDTSTTLFDMARRAATHGIPTFGGMATGAAVGHIFGPQAGIAAGMTTKSMLEHYFGQRAINQATAEHNRLLQPDLTQYPLKPNPLMNPPPP